MQIKDGKRCADDHEIRFSRRCNDFNSEKLPFTQKVMVFGLLNLAIAASVTKANQSLFDILFNQLKLHKVPSDCTKMKTVASILASNSANKPSF